MDISLYLLPIVIFFGLLSVYLSYKEEKRKLLIRIQSREISRRLYQISVLNSVSDKIGYTLNVKDLVDTIVVTVEELIPLSTVSSVLLHDHTLVVESYTKEQVTSSYIKAIENKMLASCFEIDSGFHDFKIVISPPHPLKSSSAHPDSPINGSIESDAWAVSPASYFNIPLSIDSKFVGLITISSRTPNIYTLEDMTLLYKIVAQSQLAIEKLQKVIEQEKGKLVAFIKSLPSGAILFLFENEKLELASINSAAMEFLRLAPVSNINQVFEAFENNKVIEQIKDVLREKKTLFSSSVILNNRYFKMFIIPVLSDQHKLLGVSLTLQDITSERETEKMRENFTNMVVHELRAPLTSIKGASTLLLSNKLSKEDQEKMLHLVKDSTERMLDDIGDLLDAAKMDAGHFSINKAVADINHVIQERTDLFKFNMEKKHIVFSLDLDESITQFEFDATRIGQVLTNLISNSIKFTPEGGKISVKSEKNGDFLKVSVTDNGVGIPDARKPLLFSRFGQIEAKASLHPDASTQGTGLGLFISKGIVESHGGSISVDSHEGSGTTMSFTLPILGAIAQSIPQPTHFVN